MSADTLILERESIHSTFRRWQTEQEPLHAQLAESLAALSAYQTHLDSWQRQLARERNELRAAREQLERDREVSGNDPAKFVEVSTELNEARDKIAALTTMLLSRTDELRTLDNRRAELAMELELSRVREKDLAARLDELKKVSEQERALLAEETQRSHGELVQRPEMNRPAAYAVEPERPRPVQRTQANNIEQEADNPVLSSIMEQFGKLRQQRTPNRPAMKKTR
jgi:chromosome segregation ATPase